MTSPLSATVFLCLLPRTTKLPFDPKDFRSLAQWITSQRQDEASFRTAISRMYYAAHLLAVTKLMATGWIPSGGGQDHGGAVRRLKRGTTFGLGTQLDHLRELREHADYHLEATVNDGNRYCPHCIKIRQSTAVVQNVTDAHWQEAIKTGNRCFPLLDRL